MERNLSEFIRRGIEKSIDETRSTLLRVISHEVRQFLDGRDPVADLRRALAGMKLEVTAQVRFVPSDAQTTQTTQTTQELHARDDAGEVHGPSVRVADATFEFGHADELNKSALRSKKKPGRKL
jgi:hypothetical protein